MVGRQKIHLKWAASTLRTTELDRFVNVSSGKLPSKPMCSILTIKIVRMTYALSDNPIQGKRTIEFKSFNVNQFKYIVYWIWFRVRKYVNPYNALFLWIAAFAVPFLQCGSNCDIQWGFCLCDLLYRFVYHKISISNISTSLTDLK